MVAKLAHDKGISVLANSQFNYGDTVPTVITPEMAREVFSYGIEKRPCFTEDGLPIPHINYLRRTDGGIVEASRGIGDDFEVTCQPAEVLEFAEGITGAVPGLRFETVATMYNGGTSFIVLSFGDGYAVRGDKSKHYQNLVMVNPCTRGRLHFVTSCVRVVCMNTLQAAMGQGEGYRICHTKNGRVMVENALGRIRTHIQAGSLLREKCDFLASRSIGTDGASRILDAVYPFPKVDDPEASMAYRNVLTKRERVMKQFESDDSFTERSYWSFLSAMTYTVEHPENRHKSNDDTWVAFDNVAGARATTKADYLDAVYTVAMAA